MEQSKLTDSTYGQEPPTQSASPPPPPRAKGSRSQQSTASDQQIEALVQALGDPHNPQHLDAADELIAIGVTAVPALIQALSPDHPWLTSYRAAEALGQIGDGRASGPLIQALSHPNSNVRWSAVRALSQVGDTRAILPLRRLVQRDRSKTSWGESVSAAAQATLDQMQSRSALWRFGEPAKTAILIALAIFTVIFALKSIRDVQAELRGESSVAFVTPILPTATPPDETAQAEAAQQTPEVTTTPAVTPTPESAATANARNNGNVRAGPGTQNRVVGTISQGASVRILGSQGDWLLIQFNETQGWIHRTLLTEPSGPVPTIAPGQGVQQP